MENMVQKVARILLVVFLVLSVPISIYNFLNDYIAIPQIAEKIIDILVIIVIVVIILDLIISVIDIVLKIIEKIKSKKKQSNEEKCD